MAEKNVDSDAKHKYNISRMKMKAMNKKRTNKNIL